MTEQSTKIIAILQARMTSSRLPGKVLRQIVGKPMLWHQINRVKRAREYDRLIIATSSDPSDDPIAELCRELKTECFRGNLDNVLDRYYRAAQNYEPDFVVRLTGDCPLADPEVIDAAVRFTVENGFDYASNSLEPTFPNGLDVEVFTFAALEKAWKEAELPSQKEHVTPYINRQPDKFKIGHFKQRNDLSYMRWTVDEPRDFEFVSAVYDALYHENPNFNTEDILELLRCRPELTEINGNIERNEGFKKSLKLDEEFKKNREKNTRGKTI